MSASLYALLALFLLRCQDNLRRPARTLMPHSGSSQSAIHMRTCHPLRGGLFRSHSASEAGAFARPQLRRVLRR